MFVEIHIVLESYIFWNMLYYMLGMYTDLDVLDMYMMDVEMDMDMMDISMLDMYMMDMDMDIDMDMMDPF